MTPTIPFASMSKAERQAFAEFQYKELARHVDDIMKIVHDLEIMEAVHGIKPKGKYVNRWIEI
jgi:hypothetical protein